MRSALGIRRIGDIHIGQVLRATKADVLQLRSVLKSWHVQDFESWPLLLRALTHPSISNWAERTLQLPKRSLGPNTLELLGDRVVGSCVASQLLHWNSNPPADAVQRQLAMAPRPSIVVRALVGNRGMALVARRIGIDRLLRWERPLPPMSHRLRLDESGMDHATGFSSNTEINALANAYEAVAGAVYLDGGFKAAQQFVSATLLSSTGEVHDANTEICEYEEDVIKALTKLVERQFSFIASRKRYGKSAFQAISSHEDVQCEVLDLEQKHAPNPAHMLHYCAVSLRKMEYVQEGFEERNFLSMASHFSVETARIVALTQAIQVLKGKRAIQSPEVERLATKVELRFRKAVFGEDGPELSAHFTAEGQWKHDGDYLHVYRLVSEMGIVGGAGVDVRNQEEGQKAITNLIEQSDVGREAWEDDVAEQEIVGKEWSGEIREESGVCESAVTECMKVGSVIEADSELATKHKTVFENIGSARDVVDGVQLCVREMTSMDTAMRSREVKRYHVLGHSATRLWSVQRSIRSSGQERVEVVRESERRGGVGDAMETALMGREALMQVEHLRVRKGYVAVGMCVQRVGCSSAMAWLSGAEALAG